MRLLYSEQLALQDAELNKGACFERKKDSAGSVERYR
jgi:hypothetical protein